MKHHLQARIILFLLIGQTMFVQMNADISSSKSIAGIPYIQNFPPQDYNAQLQNWDAVEDHRGVLYVANNSGLIEYDGAQWKTIPLANRSIAFSLAVDSDGVIYAGGVNEFGMLGFDPSGQTLYHSFINLIANDPADFSRIIRIIPVGNKVYFFANSSVFIYANNKIEVISQFQGENLNLQKIFYLNDRIMIFRSNGGLLRLLGREFTEICGTDSLNLKECGSLEIFSIRENKFIVFTEHKGIFEMEFLSETPTAVQALLKRKKSNLENLLRKNFLYTAAEIQPEQYAIGTVNGGIIITDSQGQIINVINKQCGLQNNSVNRIFINRHHHIWAMLNSGISYIELNSSVAKIAPLSSFGDSIVSMHYRDNTLFVGSFDGVYYLPLSDNSHPVIIQKVNPYQGPCYAFLDYKEQLLLGGKNLYRLNHHSPELLLENISLYCLANHPNYPDTLFLGANDGLHLITINADSSSNTKITVKETKKFPEISEIIRFIDFDSAGNAWLTSEINGIFFLKILRLNPLLYELQKYGKADGIETLHDCFVSNMNNEMIVYANQKFLKVVANDDAGTKFRFVPKTDSYGEYFNANPGEIIQFHAHEKFGIWVNTDSGFGQLTGNNLQQFQFNIFPFRQIKGKINQFLIDKNGWIWLSSFEADGIYVYQPPMEEEYKKTYEVPYSALIRKVVSDDQTVYFNGTYGAEQSKITSGYYSRSSFSQPLSMKTHIPPSVRSIQFFYSTPFFQHRDQIFFKYKLSGFDRHWSSWVNKTDKEYTNLPDGSYTFTVIAKNMYQYESLPATYTFSVIPTWYNTWIFRLFMVLMCILIMAAAFIYHKKKIQSAILNERKKYENTYLAPEKAEKYLADLLAFIEKEKPYHHPDLTINTLSEMISIPYYHLSQIINDKMNINFNEFINRYRIDEAIEMLSAKNSTNNILEIAYDVGFNSKSTFYIAFKKQTGMTPSNFKKTKGL
jgi:AraC-like DNA-binding protein/ligand-binding sensor domain-containing protein